MQSINQLWLILQSVTYLAIDEYYHHRVGMQNAAQAIAIASSPFIFNSGEMAISAIIYALIMNVILLLYILKFKYSK